MPNKSIKIMTWNLSSGIYDDKSSKDKNTDNIINNINNQIKLIKDNVCDIYLFQEVARFLFANGFINQYKLIKKELNSYNFCFINNKYFLTFEGKSTFTKFNSINYNLFIPYKSNTIKKDIFISNKHNVITRVKINDKELVIFNIHLAPYKVQKELREKQFRYIIELANKEIDIGNYVVVGGDFNMNIKNKIIDNLNIAISDKPTCRDINEPYTINSKMNYYDGFIYSNNLELKSINIVDNFKYSDHCPVIVEFEIKER
jgi:endonuclease/exonuclease/phosphatase family metal-dependent hydrolase